VPAELEITSEYEKKSLVNPGVVQFSKVAGILKNRKISQFVKQK